MNHSQFIGELLKKASDIAQSNYGKVSGTVKPEDNNQVLTVTDTLIAKLFVSKIIEIFPSHNIIDEETGVVDKHSDYTWVVDPIDGTSNFANAVPTYGIMIGLLQKAVPIVGGIVLPAFDDFYIAEKGSGAYLNGHKLTVSGETKLSNSLVAYGIDGNQKNPDFTKDECRLLAEIILSIRSLRSTGSNAFDCMYVASGKYGGYLNKTSKIWDNIAPQIIIEEAGGIWTDFFGNPIEYSEPLKRLNQNFTSCTAAPEIHVQLQQIIQSNR